MQDDKGTFTFRQWNPEKINVSWDENNDSNTDATCPIMPCCCCWAVEKLFKTYSMEVMNYCSPGKKSLQQSMDNAT